MPQYQITAPDGSRHIVTAPDGATQEQVLAYAQQNFASLAAPETAPEPAQPENKGILTNLAQGALKGASGIGTTLLWPADAAKDALMGQDGAMSSHQARKAALGDFFAENANPESLAFRGGDLAASIAGTAGVGGALAKGAQLAPLLARFAPALESGGFTLAKGGSALGNAATRLGAGAAVGGASAGLIDPETAGTGALIGGAIPGATKLAGMAGSAAAMRVAPEVAALYEKAAKMGIRIPADRLANSAPLNALASSLRYIPLSGRKAVEDGMLTDINRAASRTMGQDTSNLAAALRDARRTLGAKFDATLSGTAVKVDQQLLDDLAQSSQRASAELVPSQAAIIDNQINEVLAKAGNGGAIEGQAFYNLKKTLDRVGNRATPEAFYAQDLRNKLVDALNRSLGPDEAAAFAELRGQYGNMKTLQKLAPNGAEGEITAGRLGAIRGAKSQDLQDVADIAAQFAKTRESPHGAAQRVFLGALGLGGPVAAAGAGAAGYMVPALAGAGVMGAGRVASEVLRSRLLAQLLMNPQAAESMIATPLARTVPVATLASQGSQQ